jgi:uncharacterized membrane protein YkvA (DUF1232 family)
MLARLKIWAKALMRDVHALYLAGRDPRVPLPAKVMAIVVAAYALSPIDLIPDFIPVLGYLDDLILIPLGIWLVTRMIPANLMEEHRAAASKAAEAPESRAGMIAIAATWIALACAISWAVWIRMR